ncbi:MAG: hypothetical protein B7Y95_04550 [Rhizobiales bacterium 32-66-11]|nr:MAG: hypothetical protein B7Y95_04550 [Rhizobiales bacterium 32-66-11]
MTLMNAARFARGVLFCTVMAQDSWMNALGHGRADVDGRTEDAVAGLTVAIVRDLALIPPSDASATGGGRGAKMSVMTRGGARSRSESWDRRCVSS